MVRANLAKVPQEVVGGVAILTLLLVLLVPLPSIVLDLLLAINMVAAFLLVMLAVTVDDRARLSVFPTALLLMTLGRLALNVASTRLILTQGTEFSGVMVRAFGSWVLGGSYAVGLVLFAILVAIQYFVVAKGSERVAEVAARFRLDMTPMKQMGIEARVQDKSLAREAAEDERARLQLESDFFGALDGAIKFVKGETVAGMLITAINLVGGTMIGLAHGQGGVAEVMGTFCLLTVGDGLVGLIPSMMVALAAGLVVTRTEGAGALAGRVVDEALQNQMAVGVALLAVGVLMALFGFFSGVDPLGFLVLAVLCFAASGVFLLGADEEGAEVGTDDGVTVELGPETHAALVTAFPEALAVNLDAAARLLTKETGVPSEVPRLFAAEDLEEGAWRVRVRGLVAAEGRLDVERYLAVHPGEAPVERLEGDPDKDPCGNRPAMLIPAEAVGHAVQLGYQVMNPAEVLGARVGGVLVASASDLMGVEETETWLQEGARRYPAVTREISAGMGTVEVRDALAGLLSERVSIRPPIHVLEALSRHKALRGQALVEALRGELGRIIAAPLIDGEGLVRALVLAPGLEATLRASLTPATSGGGEVLGIDPELGGELLMMTRARSQALAKRGLVPVLVVSRRLRPHLATFLRKDSPDLRVLAFEELEGAELRVEARLERFERAALA